MHFKVESMRLSFIRCKHLDRLQFAVNLDYNHPQQKISVFNIKVFKFCKIFLNLMNEENV